eukprot:5620260-Pyramimonas_sp.AAC.1
MTPFLVPTHDVTSAIGINGGETTLPKYSVAASGAGQETHMHRADIYRIASLARSHPMVCHAKRGPNDKEHHPQQKDRFGRAEKWHQSPFDLHVSVAGRVEIIVGCSVNATAKIVREDYAAHGLLGLWWKPASKARLSLEQ